MPYRRREGYENLSIASDKLSTRLDHCWVTVGRVGAHFLSRLYERCHSRGASQVGCAHMLWSADLPSLM